MSLQLPANGSLIPRGDLVATFDEKRNLWITTLDGNHTCRVGDGTHAVFQSAFTPDSRYVVTAEVGNSSVGMWRTADCAFVRALKGHTAEVRAVSVSADGRYVVSGSADESARLWDAATGAFISAFSGNGAAVVQAEIAGDLMLVSACDSNKENHARKRMSAWRVRDGSLVWSRDATPHMKVQTTFEHLPSGRLLIVDDIATQVDLVEEATGRTLRTRKLPGAFFELKASPDGRRIVASVRGQNALVLDADTLANIGELEANTVHSIAFSRDSHFVFVAAIGVGFVFDLESRRLLAQRPDTEIVLTAPDRDRAVLLPSGKGSPHLWMFDTDPVSTQRLHELVRCRVPFKMEDGRVTKVTALPTDCPAEL
jgi:WD40 repeat protein